jgi:hypothetical protein
MTFEIPFNSAIATQKNELRFKLAWKKNLRKTAYNLIAGLVILFFAVLIIASHDSKGYIFLWLGVYSLISTFSYFRLYLKRRSQWRQLIRDIGDKRVKEHDITTYEFNDSYFYSKDMLYEQKIQWAAFKEYEVIEGNLFLRLAETLDGNSIILGENEVGTEEFKSLVDYVGTRVGLQGK